MSCVPAIGSARLQRRAESVTVTVTADPRRRQRVSRRGLQGCVGHRIPLGRQKPGGCVATRGGTVRSAQVVVQPYEQRTHISWIAAAAYRQSPLLVAGLNSERLACRGPVFCTQSMVLEYPAVLVLEFAAVLDEDRARKPTSLFRDLEIKSRPGTSASSFL